MRIFRKDCACVIAPSAVEKWSSGRCRRTPDYGKSQWLFPNPLVAKCQPGNEISRRQRAGVTARHFRHRSNIFLPLSCGEQRRKVEFPEAAKTASGNSFRQLRTYRRPLVGRHGGRCPLLLSLRKKVPPIRGSKGVFVSRQSEAPAERLSAYDKFRCFAPSPSRRKMRLQNLRYAEILEFPRRAGC